MIIAHVFDGSVLKSFLRDTENNSYLVKLDLSTTPLTVTKPVLLISYLKVGYNEETPINAFMSSTNPAMKPTLTVFLYGSPASGFDQINFVDEETGVMTAIVGILDNDLYLYILCI